MRRYELILATVSPSFIVDTTCSLFSGLYATIPSNILRMGINKPEIRTSGRFENN